MRSPPSGLFLLSLALVGCGDKPDSDTGTADDTAVVDLDGDGHSADEDCDDGNDAVFPGAVEVCDGLDNDCDSDVDEDAVDATLWAVDADGDGHADGETQTSGCEVPADGITDPSLWEDCDDEDATVHPGADEYCDEVDQDCDGQPDDADAVDASSWYADDDGDGHGDPGSETVACAAPEGHLADDSDCDDTSAEAHPGGTEICDGLDNDCDGSVDANRVPSDHATIQQAIDALPDGSEICLDAGTHADAFDVSDRALSFVGAGGVSGTVIDLGGGAYPHVTADGPATALALREVTVSGLDRTLDGSGASDGSFLSLSEGVATLEQVLFDDNQLESPDDQAALLGGLIHASDADLALYDVEVSELHWVISESGLGEEYVIHKGGWAHIDGGSIVVDRLSFHDSSTTTSGATHDTQVRAFGIYVEDAEYDLASVDVSDVSVDLVTQSIAVVAGAFLYTSSSSGSIDGLRVSAVDTAATGTNGISDGVLLTSIGTHEWNDIEVSDTSGTGHATGTTSLATGPLYISSESHEIVGLVAHRNTATASHDTDASGTAEGGAIHHFGGDLSLSAFDLRDNVVDGATQSKGGGIYSQTFFGSLSLGNGIIAGNSATSAAGAATGGGLHLKLDFSELEAQNLDVYGNSATGDTASGGGLYWTSSFGQGFSVANVSLSDNGVTGTTTAVGAEVTRASAAESGESWVYSNIFSSASAPLEGLADPTGADGNISVDPGYTDLSSASPADWDFSLSAGSGLIDAGDPSIVDVDGSTSDIGAYGGPDGGW